MAGNDLRARSALTAAVAGALWFLWQSVRLPIFAFLVILEPVARLVLSTLGLLCVLMAFFFEYATALEHFPFWGMLAACRA